MRLGNIILMELNPNAEMWNPSMNESNRSTFTPRPTFCHEDPQLERDCDRCVAPEKLGPKKLISKTAPQTATISTINIGVEDFLERNFSEESHYGSSQRPPRRSGGSVHFNMSPASKASPRQTIQTNKTAPASKANGGTRPVPDSSAVTCSIANRRRKSPGSNLVRLLHRDINSPEALSRQAATVRGQKQRQSTAGASCEKSSEGKSNVFLRHSSCELRENSGDDLNTACAPLPQRKLFSHSSPDPLQNPSRQDRCELGMSMRDMSESLSKIEELIFPSKTGQEVVMRENMAFETSPMQPTYFPELEDESLCKSPSVRSLSKNSDGDFEKSEDTTVNCIRKQRRAQSAVKVRRRNDRSMPCHEKSRSCDNEVRFRKEESRRWTLMRSSVEFSRSSVPLYGDRSDSDSAPSTEEGRDEPATRRRWPKVPRFFSSSAVRTCRDHSASKSESSFLETDSTTTQVETEPDVLTGQSDTSGKSMGRSLIKIGKSRRSKLEDSNLAVDRTTTGHESVANIESEGEAEKVHEMIFNEKQNEGFEEENEVLSKTVCFDRRDTEVEQNCDDNVGCTLQPAKESDCDSSSEKASGKDTTMIVLPTSNVSYGQTTLANRTAPSQVEQSTPRQHNETQLLFPTKEAQEQHMQFSNSSICSSIRSPESPQRENHEEHRSAEVGGFSGGEVSPPHIRSPPKNQIHPQNSEGVLPHKHLSFYFEDSSSASESADEKHVDDSSGAQHQDELDSESRDTFDVRCDKGRSGPLKLCAQKSVDVEDKAPTSILQASQAEEKYMHASLSTEKLCSILSYLGQVEQSNLQESTGISAEKGTPRGTCFYSPRENGSPRTVLEHAEDAVSLSSSSRTGHSSFHLSAEVGVDSRPTDCNPAIAATTVFDGVRKKVQELKQKISEQEAKINELKAENEKLVREREKHMLMEREKYNKQLEDQAAEYKVIIQHHLSVNEKMLRDKEQLSEKCCNLAGILSVAESKFDEKVKQLAEQWSREMKKAKELWAVGEKQRQKQWQEKKIKELKETAIRGLEPHLDNLNDKHRQELAKQEARHAEELQSKLDAQNLEYRRQMCEMRDNLQQERDKMLDNERLAAHSRMAEVAERFEQQAIQQRMRVATEITAQLERSEAGRREDKQYSQELLARFQKETSEREEALRKQMEKNVEEMAVKKDRQIEHLKSQMVATSHQFQQKFNDCVGEGLKEKEKELRAKLTKERDEQIEIVIEKLECEKEELLAENKKEVTEKVNEVLAAKREVELELKEFKSKFAELSKAILSHKADTDKEHKEAEKKAASLRKEIQNQSCVIEDLRDQVSQHEAMLKNQEEVYEARLKDEQTRLQQTKSDLHQSNSKANEMRTRKVEELAEVEARVRQAIVKKDVVIAHLREQLLTAHRQIKTTEYLLQREHNAFVSES